MQCSADRRLYTVRIFANYYHRARSSPQPYQRVKTNYLVKKVFPRWYEGKEALYYRVKTHLPELGFAGGVRRCVDALEHGDECAKLRRLEAAEYLRLDGERLRRNAAVKFPPLRRERQ